MIASDIRATDSLTRERVTIPTCEGCSLAGELSYAAADPSYAALLVNPHPHMGGSMENNLIVALSAHLAEAGAVTLRFDYRGVGESEGSRLNLHESLAQFWRTGRAPEDPLMIADARAAMRWMRGNAGDLPLVVVGYSFGAWAAVEAIEATERAPAAVVLVSPTVAQHDFDRLGASGASVLVIYSDNDFATPAERTRAWIGSLAFPVMEKCFCGAEHFFRGRETEVADACIGFFRSILSRTEAA